MGIKVRWESSHESGKGDVPKRIELRKSAKCCARSESASAVRNSKEIPSLPQDFPSLQVLITSAISLVVISEDWGRGIPQERILWGKSGGGKSVGVYFNEKYRRSSAVALCLPPALTI